MCNGPAQDEGVPVGSLSGGEETAADLAFAVEAFQ